MLVQKLRLKRGWSQEQLAAASGLSARTIQRLEAGRPASMETLKSLAAVFEVDFQTLSEPPMSSPLPVSDPAALLAEQQEQEAFYFVRRLRAFYLHLFRYIVVIMLLTVVNLIVSPHKLWVVGVIVGWGIGLLIHALRVFSPWQVLGPAWERAQVEKRLGRPL